MKKLLIILHVFVGVGALFGGLAAILNPINPLGISIAVLNNSPFNTFLIPGVFLFVVIGLGNVFAAWLLYLSYYYSLYISHFMGLALVAWITIQCIIMRAINILHLIYFLIGALMAFLSLRLIFSKR